MGRYIYAATPSENWSWKWIEVTHNITLSEGQISYVGGETACGQPQALFPDTSNFSETSKLDALLAYNTSLQDRFHTTANEVTMTIHYSPDIDPKHFHVEPANYRQYFHVVPGTVETVTLPLPKARNKIKLQAQALNEPGSARDKPEDESASRNDVDVFEIRVDGGTPAKKGK